MNRGCDGYLFLDECLKYIFPAACCSGGGGGEVKLESGCCVTGDKKKLKIESSGGSTCCIPLPSATATECDKITEGECRLLKF